MKFVSMRYLDLMIRIALSGNSPLVLGLEGLERFVYYQADTIDWSKDV